MIFCRTILDNLMTTRCRSKILARRLSGLTNIFMFLLIIGSISFLLISYFSSNTSDENNESRIPYLALLKAHLNVEETFLNSVKCNSKHNSRFNNSHIFNQYLNLIETQSNKSEAIDLEKTDARVLIIAESPYTSISQSIVTLLEAVRYKHRTILTGKTFPALTHADRGKFSIIIFEKLESYINLDSWNRQLLDKYCKKYSVGIISFARPDENLNNAQVRDFPLYVKSHQKVSNYHLNGIIPLLRLLKANSIEDKSLLPNNGDWTLFRSDDSRYIPIAWTYSDDENRINDFIPKDIPVKNVNYRVTNGLSNEINHINTDSKSKNIEQSHIDELSEENNTNTHDTFTDVLIGRYWPVVLDTGSNDGIQRVIFGYGLDFWIHRILMLDVISFLSNQKFIFPLERYIMVDVDDIFVGKSGTRMKKDDVEAMLAAQDRINRNFVKDFKFNLGFSGKYFSHGTEEENKGDFSLIENRHKFQWFPHSWSHIQAHTITNVSALVEDMQLNKNFAKQYDIPLNTTYSVAPHHSGVYPVHEPLYEAWDRVWGIRVTSTEEYPRLRPARHRRGFIHKSIMVLPRQTCGLFTHTIFFNDFPGGPYKLIDSVKGGELFNTIMLNRISIFMTHLSNYGNDRLALHVFESVFKFINCWTNIKMIQSQPLQMANYYFSTFPEEKEPVWRNPCNDKRHIAIWSELKTCKRLPDFLIIGPQKTGTTAMYAYLTLHPSMKSSFSNPITFEEVQFFTGKNYRKGVDWYMEQFPLPNTSDLIGKLMLFEKSANYFSIESVPQRVYALLPEAHIIALILSPAKRAYSWYQHQRAHDDATALQYTFDEVVTANESTASDQLMELRSKCLNPGFYAQHIDRWLRHIDTSKFLIVDGESLRSSPIEVMDEVQDFLQASPHINYSTLLRFSEKKGFFCPVIKTDSSSPKTKCLGPGKGRKYPEMSTESKLFLKKYFRRANIALHKMLLRLERPIPNWLLLELSETNDEYVTIANNSVE